MIDIGKKINIRILWILILLIALITVTQPVNLSIIKGSSMFPSLKENDFIITYKSRNAEVGDIVTFEPPKDWGAEGKVFIKRIIAEGGDIVSINEDKLYINNIVLIDNLNETYGVSIPEINLTIKEGYYMTVGDNYGHSKDSIYFLLNKQFEDNFLVSKENITGIAAERASEVEEIKNYVKAYNQQES